MNAEPIALIDIMVNVSFVLLGTGAFLAFIRLARGPSIPDRVVALDLIAIIAAAAIALYSIHVDEPVYLFVAIVLALIMFVATVAFAMYVEKRGGE